MYVCVCNALTDSAIERAAAAGPGTIADLYRKLEAQPTCGKCVPMVRDIARGRGMAALTARATPG